MVDLAKLFVLSFAAYTLLGNVGCKRLFDTGTETFVVDTVGAGSASPIYAGCAKVPGAGHHIRELNAADLSPRSFVDPESEFSGFSGMDAAGESTDGDLIVVSDKDRRLMTLSLESGVHGTPVIAPVPGVKLPKDAEAVAAFAGGYFVAGERSRRFMWVPGRDTAGASVQASKKFYSRIEALQKTWAADVGLTDSDDVCTGNKNHFVEGLAIDSTGGLWLMLERCAIGLVEFNAVDLLRTGDARRRVSISQMQLVQAYRSYTNLTGAGPYCAPASLGGLAARDGMLLVLARRLRQIIALELSTLRTGKPRVSAVYSYDFIRTSGLNIGGHEYQDDSKYGHGEALSVLSDGSLCIGFDESDSLVLACFARSAFKLSSAGGDETPAQVKASTRP